MEIKKLMNRNITFKRVTSHYLNVVVYNYYN